MLKKIFKSKKNGKHFVYHHCLHFMEKSTAKPTLLFISLQMVRNPRHQGTFLLGNRKRQSSKAESNCLINHGGCIITIIYYCCFFGKQNNRFELFEFLFSVKIVIHLKKIAACFPNIFQLFAVRMGFEPMTSGVTSRYSNHAELTNYNRTEIYYFNSNR